MDSFPRDALFYSGINLNRMQDSMARMVHAIAIHPDGHSKTSVNHCSHLSIVLEQVCCNARNSQVGHQTIGMPTRQTSDQHTIPLMAELGEEKKVQVHDKVSLGEYSVFQ